MPKEKLIVESDPSDPTVIFINGKKYCSKRIKLKKMDGVPHVERVVFGEMDEEQYKTDLNLVVDTLKNQTSSEELITELLKEVPPRQIKRFAKRIRDNKPVKKHHGCLGFKIGDAYLPLVGEFDDI